MLLNELTGVKQYGTKTANQLIKLLKDEYGIEQVGRGKYSLVFGHPAWDHVIKVFAKDECFMRFVDYCIRYGNGNKHLPKIKKKPVQLKTFFKHAEGIDNFYVVRVEKMKRMSDKNAEYVDMLISDEFRKKFMDVKDREADVSKFLKTYKTRIGVKKDLSAWEDLAELMYDVEAFGADPESDANEGGCFADFHDGNFMEREDGTVVISDPYADYDEGDEWSQLSIALTRFLKVPARSDDQPTLDVVAKGIATAAK